MLYLVRMDVHLPHDLPGDTREQIVRQERDYAQQLQREGKWIHLWRIVLACVRLDSVHSISCVRERGSWASSEIRPDA
ncbi:MAG: hypothetical protein CMO30_02325 [Tistrella sp.]|nr:hypothetical protein [Tistrella sp.]